MLKFKKVNRSEEEGKATTSQASLLSMALKAWGLASVVLVALAIVGYMMLLDIVREDQKLSDDEYVDRVSLHIDTWLTAYVRSVDVVAGDRALVDLVRSGSASDALVRQHELAQALGAQRVLLIVDGMESRRLGQFPLLSYAELDMVLGAQSGHAPVVEAHEPAGHGGHFDVVRAVRDGNQTVGYILVSFDTQPLLTELKKLAVHGAKLELRQRISEKDDKLLASIGENRADAPHPIVHPVAGSRWQVLYWAPEKVWQVFGVDWQITFWVTLLEIIAVLALMMAAFRRYLEGILVSDAALFSAYVKDRITGQWMGKEYTPRLNEFSGALEKLRSLNLSPQSSLKRVPRKKNLPNKTESKQTAAQNKVAEKKAEKAAFDQSYVDLIYQNNDAVSVEHGRPETPPAAELKPKVAGDGSLSRSIFRAYDIRGVVDETLTPEIAHDIGRAIGSEAWVRGEQAVVVGRDGRFSGPKLSEALIQGIRESGRDVIDIGRVPTPVLYFATHYLSARSGVMVTGSHNPPEYNGFKIVLKGEALSGSAIKSLHSRIANKDFTMGEGTLSSQDIQSDYIARVIGDVRIKRPLRIVVDCGNGVAGAVAPDILRGLGCEVTELYCEVDGHFPNHHPDPSRPENLIDLVEEVRERKADLGLAFDGDGDRLGVVDSQGNIIWPDRQMMLFSADILKNNPGGHVIYDVKSSRYLQQQIEQHGGSATMWKSGHSLLRSKLQETKALLAGEMSGHMFFNDRWYGFDDALYSAARLIEILAHQNCSTADVFAQFPRAVSTPEINLPLPEGVNFELMERLRERAHFNGAELIYIDGIRAEFDGGWGIVRASNTTPCLVFRFEAEDEEWLTQIKTVFRDELLALDSALKLPF